MARTRGAANLALYRARLVIGAWERAHSEPIPPAQLSGAFLPVVRLHLRDAYGWFLLAVSGVEEAPGLSLPQCVNDLPPPEDGVALVPELAEFRLLERGGWLWEMLQASSEEQPPVRSSARGALLGSDRDVSGPGVAMRWANELESIMARMDDSLAEY